MSDEPKPPADRALQFDRVMTDLPGPGSVTSTTAPAAACNVCSSPLQTEYYSVNGHAVCAACRQTIEATAETPKGAGPFIRASLFGLGAGAVGAAIYYAVLALADLEIGIVAILIGYIVGFAVRKGAGDRGGRRFQVLAVALTYGAVALAYAPIFISAAIKADKEQAQQTVSNGAAPGPTSLQSTEEASTTPGQDAVALVVFVGFMAALPLIAVFGSMPSGLISAAIMFFGMQQAWKMTGVPPLQILGPFQVGTESDSLPA